MIVGEDDVPADLLAALRAITDPRRRRGVRHQLVAVLGAVLCAVLAGARSYVAIAEWAHDLPAAVRKRLGIARNPPSESAFRRVLQAVEPHLLDRTVSGWLASRRPAPDPRQRWRAVAIDGKTARGARGADRGRCTCSRRSSTPTGWCSGNGSWTVRGVGNVRRGRCWFARPRRRLRRVRF